MIEKTELEDLWCFRQESAKIMALSVTQIHTSLADGNSSVLTLTETFKNLSDFCIKLQALARQVEGDAALSEIEQLTNHMWHDVTQAIISFQFHDRLTQRLEHVADSLEEVGNLIRDESNLEDSQNWGKVCKSIRDSYSMEAEHVMYEAIMEGKTAKEALDIYNNTLNEQEPDDGIELF